MFEHLQPLELSWLYLLMFLHYAWPVIVLTIAVVIVMLYVKKRTKTATILLAILLTLFVISVFLSKVI